MEVNGESNGRMRFVADCLFYMLPLLAATYVAIILVPAASQRWPARFMSWQELSLVMLVVVLSAASARPLYRLRHDDMRRPTGLNGIAATISLFAVLGGTAALLLHSSRWVVGAFLISAALPPVVRSLAVAGKDEADRRFNI